MSWIKNTGKRLSRSSGSVVVLVRRIHLLTNAESWRIVYAELLAFGFLLICTAVATTPSLDEPSHLVAGLRHVYGGDFSLYRVNPPLVRIVASVPVAVAGYEMDFPPIVNDGFSRNEFQLGEQFVKENGRRSILLIRMGRLACLPFSMIGALTCFWWGRDLYGNRAGLLACSLWCFSPMVLGHASLLTPDAPAAALGALACYSFWLWLKRPTWQRTLSAGLILGLAELCKTTLILFYPLWPVLWLAFRWSDRLTMTFARWRSEALMLVARMAISIYLINLGYLGTGSLLQLKDYVFRSEMFGAIPGETEFGNHFKDSWLGNLPVPLPYDYVLGIDHQQADFEHFWGPSYLRGQFQERGWWYYYLYALLVKTPLGTLGLLLTVIWCRFRRIIPSPGLRHELVLLVPAMFVLIVVSSKTGFNHHLRYLFPCFPLAFIWIGQAARVFSPKGGAADQGTNDLVLHHDVIGTVEDSVRSLTTSATGKLHARLLSVVVGGFALCTLTSSLWHVPHSLAYFNAFAGGPRNGPEHLLNSNIDWGQDLLNLERWIEKESGTLPVFLAFDNYYNPFDLEIPRIAPWPFRGEPNRDTNAGEKTGEPTVPEGHYAISVNQLYEFPWQLRDRNGSRYHLDKRPLKALRAMEPVGWAGYSIRVFSADQVRAAYEATLL